MAPPEGTIIPAGDLLPIREGSPAGAAPDDAEIAREVLDGRTERFEILVHRYEAAIYRHAWRILRSREDAEDITQEAFIRAYTNIRSLNLNWGFFPWFYQILRNLCFSHLRKRKSRPSYSLDAITEQMGATFESDCAAPQDAVQTKELQGKVWQAIAKLDEKHREVIVLRHFRNLSYEQMSKVLFCSIGTVTSRLNHARMKLKEKLERQKGGQQL